MHALWVGLFALHISILITRHSSIRRAARTHTASSAQQQKAAAMALGDTTPASHPPARDTRKRRSRGSLYAVHLWGANPRHSGELEYVRSHGEQLIHKVLNEDENWKYVSLKQVHDVRIYTPVAPPIDDDTAATSSSATSTTEAALSASSGGRTLSATSATSAKDRPSPQRMLPGRCDFRAMTRVAGSIDTIMEILAADEDREAYWTALNTQKGLRASHVFGSQRLAADAPFPRWSQRYLATRFTKYSTKSVDCCFAEYATLTPAGKQQLRQGFIYRRSVDESLFEMAGIKARLAKYDDECERMFIQDWLYEVAETRERNVCKVVLTCSVYFSGDYSRSLRAEFHDYATDVMVQVRQVLAKHWRELQGEPAEDAASSHQSSAATLLTNAFHLVKPGQARYCSVCSNKFSLLRKRHTCRTCCASVCSKCATTTKRRGFGQPVPGDRSGNNCSSSDRECTLCIQFSDETAGSRSSASASHRNFVTAMSSSATEYDDDEGEDDDNGAVTSSSRSIIDGYDVRKNFFASVTSSSSRGANKTPPPTSISVTTSLRGAPRKARNDSSDSTRSAPDVGVVLISDLDALTLSGRVRGAAVAAQSRIDAKRPVRTVSEDNVLHARDSLLDEDDLASFTLKLK